MDEDGSTVDDLVLVVAGREPSPGAGKAPGTTAVRIVTVQLRSASGKLASNEAHDLSHLRSTLPLHARQFSTARTHTPDP
jgi:hypothetical protein